ncbi:MAG: DUF87 domain-containing protein, partial [Candidatus Harrisonbacteria bacterium]|nr:DUF87 domain-containing protein [Candidatus Harrisonbacteria bacterium]
MSPLTFSIIVAAVGATGLAVYWLTRYVRHRKLLKSLNRRLLLIRLPLRAKEEQKTGAAQEPLNEIGLTSQLIAVLARPNAPVCFEIAVHNIGEEIMFYLALDRQYAEFAMRQIEGIWSEAKVNVVPEDYTIFNAQGEVKAAFVKLRKHYALPIRSYAEAKVDTFAPLLSNFSKLNAVGEGIALQVIVQPAVDGIKTKIQRFIRELKKGETLEEALKMKFGLPKSKQARERKEKEGRIVDEEAVKALEQKIAKPLYAVNVRLVASAPTPYRAMELLEGLGGSFAQFAAPLRNEFQVKEYSDVKKALYKYIFREYDSGEEMILGADELASIFHLPIASTDIPRVHAVKAREASPPPQLPKAGTLVGESMYRGERRPVFITDEDRRRHVYVVGQTGTGKSNLLVNMVRADSAGGKGVAVIDPHGDLVDAIISAVPPSRYGDIIVFDPGDRMYPLGLNMLEYDSRYPEQKTFIVNEMQGIFNRLFSQETMGPMFEQYMRNALLLLMEDAENEPATLMEVPRVFTDPEFRKRKLARIHNPTVVDFWEKEAVKAGG